MFSLGARIENVPLREYLASPARITSALRQVCGHLPADGVTCCFDPFLEAEALGAALDWQTEEGPAELRWAGPAAPAQLPAGMRPPELAAKSGRIPAAVEVIRRMKGAVRDSALLMAGLSGPPALANLLWRAMESGGERRGPMPAAALEASGAALGEIARALLEAGADAVLIQERISAGLPEERVDRAVWQLRTVINIVRFYEALPVLLLAAGDARGPLAAYGGAAPACIVCSDWKEAAGTGTRTPVCGISLPANAFDGVEGIVMDAQMAQTIRAVQPAVVTTAGDLSRIASLKRLAQLGNALEE